MNKILVILISGLLLTSMGCNKDESTQEKIDKYLKDNNLEAQSTADGLYYIIEVPGSEEKPNINSTVTVDYHGTLTNGNKFDSSYDRGEPSEFPLNAVIKGWQLGIPLFGKGGKGKLIIPPFLGYGSSVSASIPANSVLVFDIELHDFK